MAVYSEGAKRSGCLKAVVSANRPGPERGSPRLTLRAPGAYLSDSDISARLLDMHKESSSGFSPSSPDDTSVPLRGRTRQLLFQEMLVRSHRDRSAAEWRGLRRRDA